MEKRVLVALAISFAIFAIWSILFPPPPPVKGPVTLSSVTPTPIAETSPETFPEAFSTPSPGTEVVPAPEQAERKDIPEGPPLIIGNDCVEIAFQSPSGRLKSIKLLNFPEEGIDIQNLKRKMAKSRGPDKDKLAALIQVCQDRLDVLEEKKAQIQVASGEEKAKLEKELARMQAVELMPSGVPEALGIPLALREVKGSYLRNGLMEQRSPQEIVMSFALENGLVLKESFRVVEGYITELDISLENPTAGPLSWALARGYELEWGGAVGIGSGQDYTGGRFSGPASRVGWKMEKHQDAGLVKAIKKNNGAPLTQYGDVQYLAMRGKYFMVALLPETASSGVQLVTSEMGGSGMGLFMQGVTVPPGETVHHRIQLYLGPKDYDLVSQQKFHKERLGLEKVVDLSYYAIFEDLSLLILRALEGFKKITHDYGLAIILLTIVVKILFFPLTFKSISSMRKMQELQPIMQQMKQQHKNNPKLMQQEMSKLYKKHKVNPLSGCLPMTLQMPVFITLFGTLSTSIRLRGQPFLNTWVKDLSSPDTVGHLPDALPLLGGLPINILPLIMGVGMIFQQKYTSPPAVTDEQIQQQKIMMFMPLFFLFICYSMPSGLVLYWLVQTGLSLVEQTVVKKMRPLKKIEIEPVTAKKGPKKS